MELSGPKMNIFPQMSEGNFPSLKNKKKLTLENFLYLGK